MIINHAPLGSENNVVHSSYHMQNILTLPINSYELEEIAYCSMPLSVCSCLGVTSSSGPIFIHRRLDASILKEMFKNTFQMYWGGILKILPPLK